MSDAPGDAPGPPRKGPAAFRTISEASAELGVPQHVLRFWETRFAFIRPMKRAGGRRFYRPQDLDVLRGVRALLQEEGYTIKGVQKLHKEQGLRRMVAASGVGEASAARLAAELEAEDVTQDLQAPSGSDGAAVDTRSSEDADAPQTADLFADAPPKAKPAEDAPPAPPTAGPTTDPTALSSSRPILESEARRRLAEVLVDLESTKAGIDALLQES